MSLHGSLDSFSIPDVLVFLGGTGKTGELHVAGDGRDGRVWFTGGKVVAAEAGRPTDVINGVFELLRMAAGDFGFTDGVAPAVATEEHDVAAVLAAAQSRLDEWREIEAVVPSPRAEVAAVAAIAGPVTITPEHWVVIAALVRDASVGAVGDHLGLNEFDSARAVKALVDAGLLTVTAAGGDGEAAPAGPAEDLVEIPTRLRRSRPARASAPAPVPEAPAEAEAEPAEVNEATRAELVHQLTALDDDAEAGDAATGEDGDAGSDPATDPADPDENGLNRGTLLKFLSSVRS